MRRKMFVLTLLVLIIASVSFSFTKADDPKYKNLKVLDKNISKDEMTLIMKGFKTALGVKCSYCHAEIKGKPGKLDFASDDNEHKIIARDMMRMTNRINKKYFKDDKSAKISCYSCHNGNEEPKEAPKEVLDEE